MEQGQLGLLDESPAAVRERHTSVVSLKEFDPVSAFDRADVPAQAGLAHIQPFCGASKAQLFGKSHDGYKGSNIDEALHGPLPLPARADAGVYPSANAAWVTTTLDTNRRI